MKKISVIVPVYNVELYLRECIESILNQSLTDIELILIDDSSTDGSLSICKEYELKDTRVTVIHKKNEGQGIARNVGIDKSTGEYLLFIDSDDYIDLDTCERLYNIAKNNNLDHLRYVLDRFDANGLFFGTVHDSNIELITDTFTLRKIAACYISPLPVDLKHGYWNGGSACVCLYRAAVIKKNSIYFKSERQLLGEDSLFNFENMQYVKRYGRINYSFYHYRKNPVSFSKAVNLDRVRALTFYCRELDNYFKKYDYTDNEAKSYAGAYFCKAIRGIVKNVFLSRLTIRQKRKWFHENTGGEYLKCVFRYAPWRNFEFKHKICFILLYRKCFWLYYLLVRIGR